MAVLHSFLWLLFHCFNRLHFTFREFFLPCGRSCFYPASSSFSVPTEGLLECRENRYKFFVLEFGFAGLFLVGQLGLAGVGGPS
ncbi:hypothetical protein YC2023_103119 [Brassica napus]